MASLAAHDRRLGVRPWWRARDRIVGIVVVLALIALPACGVPAVADAPVALVTPVASIVPTAAGRPTVSSTPGVSGTPKAAGTLRAAGTPTVAGTPARPVTPTAVVRGPAATFQVTYDDTMPQQARAAFANAIAIWSARLVSPVPIRVKVTWTKQGRCRNSCTLASAGPTTMLENFPNAPLKNTLYPIALANKLAGKKLNDGADDDPNDIEADFNSQADWFYGEGTPPNGRTSFLATAVHELAHGLGFSGSLTYEDGIGAFESPPNIFDRFVVNGSGQRLIDAVPNGSRALGAQLVGDKLFFEGANARAAAGGRAPKLYAPTTWEEGSSLSHLDQETYISSPDAMMTPNDEGGGTATPGPITIGIFADLGWTITAASSAVPQSSPAPHDTVPPRPDFAAVSPTAHPRQSFRAVRR